MGTKYLHLLTRQSTYKVHFIVENKANKTHYAEFDIFSVEDKPSGHPLWLGRFTGEGEDYLTNYHSGYGGMHHNTKFSTTDKDQGQASGNSESSYGGWWYKCQNTLYLLGRLLWQWGVISSLILIKPMDVC